MCTNACISILYHCYLNLPILTVTLKDLLSTEKLKLSCSGKREQQIATDIYCCKHSYGVCVCTLIFWFTSSLNVSAAALSVETSNRTESNSFSVCLLVSLRSSCTLPLSSRKTLVIKSMLTLSLALNSSLRLLMVVVTLVYLNA